MSENGLWHVMSQSKNTTMTSIRFKCTNDSAGVEVDGEYLSVGTIMPPQIAEALGSAFGFGLKTLTERGLSLMMWLALRSAETTSVSEDGTTQYRMKSEALLALRGWNGFATAKAGCYNSFGSRSGSTGVRYLGGEYQATFQHGCKLDTPESCEAWVKRPIETRIQAQSDRVVFHPLWNWDTIRERVLQIDKRVVTIYFRQTWVPGMEGPQFKNFKHSIEENGKKIVGWLYLLGSEELMSFRVKARVESLSDAAGELARTISRFKNIFGATHPISKGTSNAPPESLNIGFYEFMPFGPILMIEDQVLFAGLYPSRYSSDTAPMLEVCTDQDRDVPCSSSTWNFFKAEILATHRRCTIEIPEWIR